MKYIKIKNVGEIDPNALHLVGASTKVGNKTKIGMFGSGNKYALAYFLRNGHDVTVFAGLEEIKITTENQILGGIDFEVILINGIKTSITTQMGKDWQFWQAMREIYCNAIDEGEHAIDFVFDFKPIEGETHFYIEAKNQGHEFVQNFDNYFADKKKVLFECDYGRILESSGETANIYRKGIKCFNSTKKSMFDYDFNDVDIDENRLIKYYWEMEEKIWNLIYSCTNKEVVLKVLHNCYSSNILEGSISDVSSISSDKISQEFREVMSDLRIAPSGMSGLLTTEDLAQTLILPTKVFESMRGVIGEKNINSNFKVSLSGPYIEIPLTELHQETLRLAYRFFDDCQFTIPYNVKLAMFQNKDVLGMAINDTIFLSDIGIERGVKDVVNTIIEEYVHLKYNCQDRTRKMQTSLISELVNYMEKTNSYAI